MPLRGKYHPKPQPGYESLVRRALGKEDTPYYRTPPRVARYLYHATKSKNLDSILHRGLVPGASSGAFGTPEEDRELVWLHTNFLECQRAAPALDDTPDVMLRIDTKYLNRSLLRKPVESEELNIGWITYPRPIPPQAIRFVGKTRL